MNPANGVSNSAVNFNGGGDAFPMVGSGNVYYAQAGYLFPTNFLTKGKSKIQVVSGIQYASYYRLKNPMLMYEAGFNVFLHKNNKVSFTYQNRPVYSISNGQNIQSDRKGMFVLQYQISI